MSKISFLKKLHIWYRERYFWHLKKKSLEAIFSNVYQNNEWGGQPGTFYSGDGTHSPAAVTYIENVAEFINDHNIKSVLDIGCGDFTIMQKVLEKTNVHYTGADVVPALIKHHQKTYTNEQNLLCHSKRR